MDKLNSDYIKYKKVIRVTENGKSSTITNKTDKEIIKLYNDIVQPMDENKTHSLREPYIKAVEYTEKYKSNVLFLSYKEHPLLKK